MAEKPLALPESAPRKKVWRRWKLAGLILFVVVLLLNRWLPGWVFAIGYLYGIVVIANLLFHLFRYLKNRLFWRVRNRLLGSFIFVGVIPLLLLALIGFVTGYLLFGALAGRYFADSLHEIENRITEIDAGLAGRLTTEEARTRFVNLAALTLSDSSTQFPGLAALLLHQKHDGSLEIAAEWDPRHSVTDQPRYAGAKWLAAQRSFEGLLRDGEKVWMTSLQPVPDSAGYTLVVSVPLDQNILERMQREKSIYFALAGVGSTQVTVTNREFVVSVDENPSTPGAKSKAQADLSQLERRVQTDKRRMVSWFAILDGKEYSSGKNERIGVAVIDVPLETIYHYSVGSGGIQDQILLSVLYALAIMFAIVELVSVVIGFTISRRITRSANDMYQGMLALQKGDLQHRIPVRRNDQLGFMAQSFNQMSASITRLLEEVSEKKRLEQELEIAREVQATLFPKQLPRPRGMVVFGGCEPARVVSGDYYDFIVEDEARLDIVVADISGKGISAALLMANLQAAMRNQLLSLKHDDPGKIDRSLAAVVEHLNQQIYLNSPAEKYATLFLSRYDAEAHRLWYCNGGHLPPILLDDDGVHRLEPTGTVVGLLPGAGFEARSVALPPGSLLAIFTDGVTGTVNKSDEEFGEERLIDSLKQVRGRSPEQVYRFVVERIRDWQGELPQHDDITLIVAQSG